MTGEQTETARKENPSTLLRDEADTSPPRQDQEVGQEYTPTSINTMGFLYLALNVDKDQRMIIKQQTLVTG